MKWILIFLVFLVSCTEPVSETLPLYPDLGLCEEDSTEAIILSYFLDQSLTATDSSVGRNLYHLNYLRTVHKDSFPFVDSLRFRPPWGVGYILLGLDSLTIEQLLAGEYEGMSTLPENFRPDSIVVTSANLGLGKAYISEFYHPVLMAEIYGDLSGIRWASAAEYGVFDYPRFPILAFDSGDTLDYIFLNGCIPYQFRYSENEPVYLRELGCVGWPGLEYVNMADEFMDWGNP